MLPTRVLLVVTGLCLLECGLCVTRATPTAVTLRPATLRHPLRRVRAVAPQLSQLPQVDDDEDEYTAEDLSPRFSLGPSDVALRSMLTFGLLCAATTALARATQP